jgi:hypothetical protein
VRVGLRPFCLEAWRCVTDYGKNHGGAAHVLPFKKANKNHLLNGAQAPYPVRLSILLSASPMPEPLLIKAVLENKFFS